MTLTLPAGSANSWLGNFGERWVQTICTAAACPSAKVDPDQVGTDIYVHNHSHETIRVQIKTTEHPHVVGAAYSFQLDAATYNRLRTGNAPGFLVLVVLGSPHPRWTGHCQKGSIVRAGAYWTRLDGRPAITAASVAVSLPFANLLTPSTLIGLF